MKLVYRTASRNCFIKCIHSSEAFLLKDLHFQDEIDGIQYLCIDYVNVKNYKVSWKRCVYPISTQRASVSRRLVSRFNKQLSNVAINANPLPLSTSRSLERTV